MRKKLMLVLFLALAVVAPSVAFAQESGLPIVPDNMVTPIIVTVAITAGFAPIFGFATTAKPEDKFDWKQYWRALVIGIPTVTVAVVMQLLIIDATAIQTTGGYLIFFVVVFLEALGVDYGKSRVAKAILKK